MGNGKGYPSESPTGWTVSNGFVGNKRLTTAERVMGETDHD